MNVTLKGHSAVRLWAILLVAGLSCCDGNRAAAEIDNQQGVLQAIFPAGGSRGTSVDVLFTGNKGGLKGADGLLIDGPPGLTVEKFEAVNENQVRAKLAIAADAITGRRMIRVKGGATGLTNFRWFLVGALKEHTESAKNNEPAQAERVETPLVVNGRIEAVLDQDCFRFRARERESLVLAVHSHGLDAMGFDRNTAGFADASLELLDETGRIVAEDGDSLGYDPLIHFVVPKEGWYTVRISGMGYKGFPQFVYRMTIGEVPYPTAAFPPGGKRGESVEVTFSGPNVPTGAKRTILIEDDRFPIQYVSLDGSAAELPVLRSDSIERIAKETGNDLASAMPVSGRPLVISGCFDEPGDADWYRLELGKGEKIFLDVFAQRHLRSPVDTLIEIYDARGKPLAQNDDGQQILSEVDHDFVPFDSQLSFETKQPGAYFVRIAEQSGSGGPRAVYRLKVTADPPDFQLYQWPDAVPVWGPGTTAGFVAEIHRFGNLKDDVEIAVEGLPAGWQASRATAFATDYRHAVRGAFGHKVFLTITAPANAAVGDMAEFRVVGRAKTESGELVRTAEPLTQLAWGEPNHFRGSVKSRVVVAPPQGLPIIAGKTTLAAKANSTVELPLIIPEFAAPPSQPVSLSVNRAGTHFACSVGPPVKVQFADREGLLKFPLPAAFQAGREYELLVSNAWTSETRKGLPGPCTTLIRVKVTK